MRIYTKDQIHNIALNILFDLDENVPYFSHCWDCSEVTDREAMTDSIKESIIRRLELEID